MSQALKRLSAEFPRSSYQIITKVGKYGPFADQHIFDAETTRKSIERSLKRFNTDYLDAVCELPICAQSSISFFGSLMVHSDLHDIEFITPYRLPAGHHLSAQTSSPEHSYHLAPPHEPLGPGDEHILDGLRTLRALQKEGKIRQIGICAYPLPEILRICLLAAATPDIGPLDILQVYAHQSLLNSTLSEGYLAAFEQAGVKQVISASPLAMGALTTVGPPDWLAARLGDDVMKATREASEWCIENGTRIEEVAASFGFKELRYKSGIRIPIVAGCKNVDEVKRTVQGWRKANLEPEEPVVAERIAAVKQMFTDKGVRNWSYASP